MLYFPSSLASFILRGEESFIDVSATKAFVCQVERERFYSSAEATASFLRSQMNGFDAFALAEKDKDGDREGHGGSCYIIGESGLA